METNQTHRGMLKPTLVLTTLLFLITAPTPDSRDIAEMTANFIVPANQSGLMAADESMKTPEEESGK